MRPLLYFGSDIFHSTEVFLTTHMFYSDLIGLFQTELFGFEYIEGNYLDLNTFEFLRERTVKFPPRVDLCQHPLITDINK